jgi:hypothetical protein
VWFSQVALCLLNTGTEVTSDNFGYFGASFNKNYLVEHCRGSKATSFHEDDNSDSGSAALYSVNSTDSRDSTESFSGDLELQEEEVELEVPDSMLEEIIPETSSGSKSFGPAPFYKVPEESDPNGKKKALPIHYPTHYWFRGEQLAKLTAFEYAAMVQVVPHKQIVEEEILQALDENNDSDFEEHEGLEMTVEHLHNKPGRPPRRHFRFHHLHPLCESHAQVLRSKQNTLIINGYAPKYPGPRPLLQEDSDTSKYENEEYREVLRHWTGFALQNQSFQKTRI